MGRLDGKDPSTIVTPMTTDPASLDPNMMGQRESI